MLSVDAVLDTKAFQHYGWTQVVNSSFQLSTNHSREFEFESWLEQNFT
jgi:hypothetical protein